MAPKHEPVRPGSSSSDDGNGPGRWENEGGARRVEVPPPGVDEAAPGRGAGSVQKGSARAISTPAQESAQDARQDGIMTAQSPDGRPPRRRLRRREWWWLIAGLLVVLTCGVVYAAVSGAEMMTVILAVVLVTALFGAAVPVWGAGLLRGREQRSAHRGAVRGPDDTSSST